MSISTPLVHINAPSTVGVTTVLHIYTLHAAVGRVKQDLSKVEVPASPEAKRKFLGGRPPCPPIPYTDRSYWACPPWTGSSRCLDAFSIALNQTDSSHWYTSTLRLQLVSLQFCIFCRSVPREHLIVDDSVRNEVWMDTPTGGRNVKPRVTRVPALRPPS